MKKIDRMDFLKQCGRWGALAAVLGFGGVLLSREKKVSCTDPCGSCAEFKNGKCGIGLK
ncbi:MAG: hypothetical protein JXR40_09955 [Pontiellaceae bacterium]|nr:hypothetical protein [Pontiellaceae bacterium]